MQFLNVLITRHICNQEAPGSKVPWFRDPARPCLSKSCAQTRWWTGTAPEVGVQPFGAVFHRSAACASRKRKRVLGSRRLIRGLLLSQAAAVKSCSRQGHAVRGSLLGDSGGASQFRQRSSLLPPGLATAGRGEQWTRTRCGPPGSLRRESVRPF